ncbi:MAG: DUF5667 domain-containing protein [Anaerolineae bacterium]|nr:DUF5667 domain-containing protein [Anaerolineae bacterium]
MPEFKHTPDSLANQLDQSVPPHARRTGPSDGDPLVEAAQQLADAPRPRLSADAKLRIQSQILQHTQQPIRSVRPDYSRLLRWALAASVALLVLLVPGAQVTLASVPGDVLYPVKQAVEQVEIALANTTEAQAALNLSHAERRTQEAQTLLMRGSFDSALIWSAYTHLADAAAAIQSDANFDPALKSQLEDQSGALTRDLAQLLDSASQPENPVSTTAIPFATAAAATIHRSEGMPDAASTPTLTPTSSPIVTETATPTETFTATGTETPTEAPTAAQMPTESPTPTLEVNLVIEGPIQAINGSIVTIYGIEILFDETDPLLHILRVGDEIRVNGNIAASGDETITITNLQSEPAGDSISVSEDGETVWRDTGNCSNPPPPWAPAKGWRSRCEDQTAPGSSSSGQSQSSSAAQENIPPGLSGSAPGQQDNPGQGNANGQNKDKEKDKGKSNKDN